jgi:hypothetical protein
MSSPKLLTIDPVIASRKPNAKLNGVQPMVHFCGYATKVK